MTSNEVIDLLTLMASYDRRTVGKADVTAWSLAVGDLSFADSQQAVVTHYRETREWIMPSDIRGRVKAIRGERLRCTPIPPPPPELRGKPAEYRRYLRETARRIADGLPAAAAIEARP
jgi:hypothetical protein